MPSAWVDSNASRWRAPSDDGASAASFRDAVGCATGRGTSRSVPQTRDRALRGRSRALPRVHRRRGHPVRSANAPSSELASRLIPSRRSMATSRSHVGRIRSRTISHIARWLARIPSGSSSSGGWQAVAAATEPRHASSAVSTSGKVPAAVVPYHQSSRIPSRN